MSVFSRTRGTAVRHKRNVIGSVCVSVCLHRCVSYGAPLYNMYDTIVGEQFDFISTQVWVSAGDALYSSISSSSSRDSEFDNYENENTILYRNSKTAAPPPLTPRSLPRAPPPSPPLPFPPLRLSPKTRTTRNPYYTISMMCKYIYICGTQTTIFYSSRRDFRRPS